MNTVVTMKHRRARLFGASRPLVRPFDPATDMWVMWAAYDLNSFPSLPSGLTIKEFGALVMAQVASRSSCLVVEDDCKYFKAGRGPVCFVAVDNFGWRIEPHADFFMWATKRMKLRCTVAFLQMARYSKNVGVCVIRSLARSNNLFRHAQRYVLLNDAGRIQMGDPRGDEYLFSIKGSARAQGEANAGTHGIGRGAGRRIQRDDNGEGPAGADSQRDREFQRDAVQGEPGREKTAESAGSGDRGREERHGGTGADAAASAAGVM